MTSKILNNVVELNKINYDSTNNRINFSTAVYSNGSPIADETAGSYANSAFLKANAAFASANNVAPQVQPAFDKANAAFEKANTGLVRQSFLANTGQTNFITNGYTIGYVDVFVNGIKLYDAEDFVATDGANVSITQLPLSTNDVVEIISHGNNPSVVARVDQFARDYVNNAWSAANSAYNFANSVYSLANNAANSAASSIPLTGSSNISGNLLPTTTNTYYLGSETQRWKSLFVSSNSIDIDGLVLSNSGGTLAVSTAGGSPSTFIDNFARSQANAAFQSANNVAPQVQPAFDKANAAFDAANNVAPQIQPAFDTANSAGLYANSAFIKANSSVQYNSNTSSNSFLALPNGTLAQRPSNAQPGSMRYNTSNNWMEIYHPTGGWTMVSADSIYNVTVYLWGGGGGGGYGTSSSGGGGGAAVGTFDVTKGTSYPIIIGGGGYSRCAGCGPGPAVVGGGGPSGSQGYGGHGGGYTGIFSAAASQATAILMAGGGGGASWEGAAGGVGGGTTGGNGGSGSSSGGSGGTQSAGGAGGGSSQAGSALQGGTASDGDGGGGGGGGGGYYGGGGGSNTNPGSGGGGGSGYFKPGVVSNGTLYQASGATAGNPTESVRPSNAGNGGTGTGQGTDGALIIRYVGTTARGSGGTISTAGGYVYHTFTSSGTFTA